MREYKHRGKRKDNGLWVYGNVVQTKYGVNIVDDSKWYEVDPETVGQYTGLKDKNGKEIYEGDILHDKRFDSGIGKVYFDTELGVWKVGFCEEDWLYEFYDCSEVIGNLWDNPELLGG